MWYLIVVIGLQLAALLDHQSGPTVLPDGTVCYRVPISESAVGAHSVAASASAVGSPMLRVDYSLSPSPKE